MDNIPDDGLGFLDEDVFAGLSDPGRAADPGSEPGLPGPSVGVVRIVIKVRKRQRQPAVGQCVRNTQLLLNTVHDGIHHVHECP